jgi:hypothetical protein
MLITNSLALAVKMALRFIAQYCKRLSPLLAAPAALLFIQGQAKAILTYNIFESAGNVVIQTSGSLDFAKATQSGTFQCSPFNGLISSSSAIICTGTRPANPSPDYVISGPSSFNGAVLAAGATSVSGIFSAFSGAVGTFTIDPSYVSNSQIVSSATFNGTSLVALGFNTTGLIGTWTLDGTSETINLILGAPTPPGATVPGPLPLLGAGAAFGWSRRLRKRIATPLITPPQA